MSAATEAAERYPLPTNLDSPAFASQSRKREGYVVGALSTVEPTPGRLALVERAIYAAHPHSEPWEAFSRRDEAGHMNRSAGIRQEARAVLSALRDAANGVEASHDVRQGDDRG